MYRNLRKGSYKQGATLSRHCSLISHSTRVEQMTTVLSSLMSLILQGCTRLFRTFITSLSHTFSLLLLRIGSVACLTSQDLNRKRVPQLMSLWPMAGDCAGSRKRITCLPPQGWNYSFLANFLQRPSAVQNRKKSNMENSSITSTSVLQSFATWIVPFSRLLLQSISKAKITH